MVSLELKRAQRILKGENITVLPDFFLDVIINPHMSYKDLIEGIQEIYERGGGNLLGPRINYVFGGNGGNVAKTLGGLGAQTTFITKTSVLGKILVEHFLHPLGVSTYIDSTGEIASSVVLEIPEGGQKRNVMLSWAGSVAQFSAKELTETQWEVLRASRLIAITNAQNQQLEGLTAKILSEISPNTGVSVDFSDLSPHLHRVKGFRERLLDHPVRPPSWVIGNETEIRILTQLSSGPAQAGIQNLSSEYPETSFALHTSREAQLWSGGEMMANVPCFKINVHRATGAGDAWHAGFLIGINLQLSHEDVLKVANATAAYQISTGNIGSLAQVVHFAQRTDVYTKSDCY
ncbi:MAG: carbohydrate kinase family protein [Candidatus Thorarchaeota archaeon]